MKVEIEVDDFYIEKKLSEFRKASFSKSLDILKEEAANIRVNSGLRYPSFLLDSKMITYEFAKILNVKTPPILQIDTSINNISFDRGTVIKPMYEHSAKGVFIFDRNGLFYLNKNIKFVNGNEAKKYAKKLVADKVVRRNKWMVEKIIQTEDGSVARDIKFYMFYGEVGLILETDRIPTIKRCWYDSSLTPVNTGKYIKNSFLGTGENLNDVLELAKAISLELPVPFVRIDFLQVDNEIYLGEFTPAPGGYSMLNSEWDTRLGEFYQKASIRLCNDIAYGKVFNKFNLLNKNERFAIDKIILDLNSNG